MSHSHAPDDGTLSIAESTKIIEDNWTKLKIEPHVDDYSVPLSVERFEHDTAEARAKGFGVVLGDQHTLLLDLDGDRRPDPRVLDRVEQLFGVKPVMTWASKSGNLHMILETKENLGVETRIALQAILASDPVRELLALARWHNGVPEPVRLFKPRTSIPTVL